MFVLFVLTSVMEKTLVGFVLHRLYTYINYTKSSTQAMKKEVSIWHCHSIAFCRLSWDKTSSIVWNCAHADWGSNIKMQTVQTKRAKSLISTMIMCSLQMLCAAQVESGNVDRESGFSLQATIGLVWPQGPSIYIYLWTSKCKSLNTCWEDEKCNKKFEDFHICWTFKFVGWAVHTMDHLYITTVIQRYDDVFEQWCITV